MSENTFRRIPVRPLKNWLIEHRGHRTERTEAREDRYGRWGIVFLTCLDCDSSLAYDEVEYV